MGGKVVSNSAELLYLLALRGDGIFLAPSFLIAEDLASDKLRRLLPEHKSVEFAINAIYPHRHNLSTKVRRFLDLLADRFVKHRHWMS